MARIAVQMKKAAVQDSPEQIQAEYYERTASHYDESKSNQAELVTGALEFIDALSGTFGLKTFLDVGAGTGRCMQFFLERGKDIRGIEPVAQLIEEAERKGIPKGLIQEGSGYSLPYPDSSIDVCVEGAVLHHVADPARVVSEMMRVARKAVILVDTNRFGQGSYLARIVKLILYKVHLWSAFRFLRTGGRMYTISEGDGLAYSYSVFDSYDQLAGWADQILLVPVERGIRINSWLHPLLNCPGVLLFAVKGSWPGQGVKR